MRVKIAIITPRYPLQPIRISGILGFECRFSGMRLASRLRSVVRAVTKSPFADRVVLVLVLVRFSVEVIVTVVPFAKSLPSRG